MSWESGSQRVVNADSVHLPYPTAAHPTADHPQPRLPSASAPSCGGSLHPLGANRLVPNVYRPPTVQGCRQRQRKCLRAPRSVDPSARTRRCTGSAAACRCPALRVRGGGLLTAPPGPAARARARAALARARSAQDANDAIRPFLSLHFSHFCRPPTDSASHWRTKMVGAAVWARGR